MLNDLKELEKFLKLCRKQGIVDISFEGVTVKFGELPTKTTNQVDEVDDIPTESLTPDQLMFYAVENAGQL